MHLNSSRGSVARSRAEVVEELRAIEHIRGTLAYPRVHGPGNAGIRAVVKIVGRYQIIEPLGQGAMGCVYLGLDPKIRREVAIKVLHEHVAADELKRKMFHREARAAGNLEHPNVLKVYDYSGPEEELQFIVMQRLRGVELGTVLDSLVQLPELIVLAMGYEASLALEHVHTNGLVHRDLKPDNLFLEPDGRVVLGDFGIAKSLESPESLGKTMVIEKSQLIGTPLYMAPEQLLKNEAGPETDIFALGGVLFHMMSGVPPFAGRGQDLLHRIAHGRVRYIRDIDPSIYVDVAALVHTMLAPQTEARPSAEDVRQQIRTMLDERAVTDTRSLLEGFFFEPDQVAAQLRQEQIERYQNSVVEPDARPGDRPGASVVADSDGYARILQAGLDHDATRQRASRRRRRILMLTAASALGVATGAGALWALS